MLSNTSITAFGPLRPSTRIGPQVGFGWMRSCPSLRSFIPMLPSINHPSASRMCARNSASLV